jgi:DNA-binding CsgD family transcriptional regulator
VAVRLAGLLAGLSRLADLGFGLQAGEALRSCALATRFARSLDLPDDDVRAAFYTAPLHHVGCTGYAHETARLFGDELVLNVAAGRSNPADPRDLFTTFLPLLTGGRRPGRPGRRRPPGRVAAGPADGHRGAVRHHRRGRAGGRRGPAARRRHAGPVDDRAVRGPHRPALAPDQAEQRLLADARKGVLDGDAVGAVLAAAGHAAVTRRQTLPAGLSAREVEVLGLVAEGCSNAQIAQRLVISRRTAEHHVQHIYTKIGASSRAAAALFAMEHHLLPGRDR